MESSLLIEEVRISLAAEIVRITSENSTNDDLCLRICKQLNTKGKGETLNETSELRLNRPDQSTV